MRSTEIMAPLSSRRPTAVIGCHRCCSCRLRGTASGWLAMTAALRAHGLTVVAISYQSFGTSVEQLAREWRTLSTGFWTRPALTASSGRTQPGRGGDRAGVRRRAADREGRLRDHDGNAVRGFALGDPATDQRHRPGNASGFAAAAPSGPRAVIARCPLAGYHCEPRQGRPGPSVPADPRRGRHHGGRRRGRSGCG
jgi:hypothetical protein